MKRDTGCITTLFAGFSFVLLCIIVWQQSRITNLQEVCNSKIPKLLATCDNIYTAFSMAGTNLTPGIVEQYTAAQKILDEQRLAEMQEASSWLKSDITDRIEMLKMHLQYKPSLEWQESVLNAANYEIRQLRHYRFDTPPPLSPFGYSCPYLGGSADKNHHPMTVSSN